jgi:hypothetical protein
MTLLLGSTGAAPRSGINLSTASALIVLNGRTGNISGANLTIGYNQATTSAVISSGGTNQNIAIDPNGSGTISLNAPTTVTNKFIVGTAGNTFVFDPTAGPTYSGTARPTKLITLSPEYAGAAITASGSANVNGNMTSDASPSANWRTYYQWVSSQTLVQDYTVAVRVTLPNDFSAWSTGTALTLNYNTNSPDPTFNRVDMNIYNSSLSLPQLAQTVCTDTNNASASKTWSTITCDNVTFNGTPAWNTAGQTAIIMIRMYSKNNAYVQIGDITLSYLAKF